MHHRDSHCGVEFTCSFLSSHDDFMTSRAVAQAGVAGEAASDGPTLVSRDDRQYQKSTPFRTWQRSRTDRQCLGAANAKDANSRSVSIATSRRARAFCHTASLLEYLEAHAPNPIQVSGRISGERIGSHGGSAQTVLLLRVYSLHPNSRSSQADSH